MEDVRTPVLVVGGGPVGLATACFLGRQGVAPMLVEKRDGTSALPRAPGIQARTLEIFRSMGLEEDVRALEMGDSHPYFEGGILRTTTLVDIDNAVVVEAPNLDGEEVSPVRVMGCGQDRYERVLVDHARAHGADIRFGHRLLGFTQDPDGVTADVESTATGERFTVRADHLVGTDGARSTVRELLGTPMTGHGTIFHAMSIYFRAPRLESVMHGRKFILCYASAAGTTVAISRLHGCDPWAGAAMYDPDKGESPADFTPRRCVELVRAIAGVPDLAVEVVGTVPWEGAQRVAKTFRTGRVFLAGDAAHLHPPAGGFGANTGIHDAHNLSWKLAAVLNGWADAALLDTYSDERQPLGLNMAEQALLRNRIRHGHMAGGDGSGMVDDVVVTLGYRYRSAAVVGATTAAVLTPTLTLDGEPGSRAPHVWLDRDGARISTIDLFSTSYTLLTGPGGGAWREAAARVSGRTGVPLCGYVLGPDGDLDTDEDWMAAYGIGPDGAVLVRPDAFVAWRAAGGHDDPETEIERALAVVLGPVPVRRAGSGQRA